MNREFLKQAGAKFADDTEKVYSGITVPYGAKVVIQPNFGVTFKEIKDRIKGNFNMTTESTVVLDGNIDIYNLELDGALHIHACEGAKVTVKNLTVTNGGIKMKEIDPADEKEEEKFRIRGYLPEKKEMLELTFPIPGQYVLDDTTKSTKEKGEPAGNEKKTPKKRLSGLFRKLNPVCSSKRSAPVSAEALIG